MAASAQWDVELVRTRGINRNSISYSPCLSCQDFLCLGSLREKVLKILRVEWLFLGVFPPKNKKKDFWDCCVILSVTKEYVQL